MTEKSLEEQLKEVAQEVDQVSDEPEDCVSAIVSRVNDRKKSYDKSMQERLTELTEIYEQISKALGTEQYTKSEKDILRQEQIKLAGILYFDILRGPRDFGESPTEDVGVWLKEAHFSTPSPHIKVYDLPINHQLRSKVDVVYQEVINAFDEERNKIVAEVENRKKERDTVQNEFDYNVSKYGLFLTHRPDGKKLRRKEEKLAKIERDKIKERLKEKEERYEYAARRGAADRLVEAVKSRLYYRK